MNNNQKIYDLNFLVFEFFQNNTLVHISCWWKCWGCWISVGEYICAYTVHGAYIFAAHTIKKGGLVGKI